MEPDALQSDAVDDLGSFLQLGGPTWTVPLGRRDSTTASPSQAIRDLLPASSNLSALISGYAKKGLNTRDMVALSGKIIIIKKI